MKDKTVKFYKCRVCKVRIDPNLKGFIKVTPPYYASYAYYMFCSPECRWSLLPKELVEREKKADWKTEYLKGVAEKDRPAIVKYLNAHFPN